MFRLSGRTNDGTAIRGKVESTGIANAIREAITEMQKAGVNLDSVSDFRLKVMKSKGSFKLIPFDPNAPKRGRKASAKSAKKVTK